MMLVLFCIAVTSRSSFLLGTLSSWFLASSIKPQDEKQQVAARIFRSEIQTLIQNDPSLSGPLLRLAFHDAATFDPPPFLGKATGGSNGSIRYELDRKENRGISRPLTVVMQTLLENNNNNNLVAFLSLADAIALAGAAAVEASGGPSIPICLGRQDVEQPDPEFLKVPRQKSSKKSLVTKTLPTPALDADGLRLYFQRFGLTEKEFVALSGCHGMGRHVSLIGMSKECMRNLTRTCLEDAPVLLPFVTASVDTFDNAYFQALLRWNERKVELGEVAFLGTDVAMVVDPGLRRYVELFANDQEEYFEVFTRAYQKLTEPKATSLWRYSTNQGCCCRSNKQSSILLY